METRWAILAAAATTLCLFTVNTVLLSGYSTQGLFAGVAIGLVFGFTTPVPSDTGSIAFQAVRTGVAFGAFTGLGFAYYKGVDLGIAWGIGGTFGVAGGDFVGLLLRASRPPGPD